MRKRYHVLIGMFVVLFCSCNNWLDVRPRNEMKEDDLYALEDGFKSALNGVYIQLADVTLYGKTTTLYLPELLDGHYDVKGYRTWVESYVSSFDYENADVENIIASMWKNYYQSIGHVNTILKNMEENPVHFTNGNDSLVEGECLGLRAFLHFDLLRYFSGIPEKMSLADKVIPYARKVSKNASDFKCLTYGEVIGYLMEDLDKAERLLEGDPICTLSNKILNAPGTAGGPEDDWQCYRQIRFNYYAVLATKARIYMWLNDLEQARKYARMVVDAKNEDGSLKFPLATESWMTSSEGNLVMTCEHIFGMENPQHATLMNDMFMYKGNYFRVNQTLANVNTNYESASHPDDIRNKKDRYWGEKTFFATKKNVFYKYVGNDSYTAINKIPVIRIAEMYLILAEALPVAEAKAYWTTYRVARSMNSFVDEEVANTEKLPGRLEREYQKEFYGEGQSWFFHKRMNWKQSTWKNGPLFSEKSFCLPLPDDQVNFE